MGAARVAEVMVAAGRAAATVVEDSGAEVPLAGERGKRRTKTAAMRDQRGAASGCADVGGSKRWQRGADVGAIKQGQLGATDGRLTGNRRWHVLQAGGATTGEGRDRRLAAKCGDWGCREARGRTMDMRERERGQ